MVTQARRAGRITAGLASAGMLAGLSFFAATPALAADDDCVAGNTVDAATATAAHIQA